MSKELAPTFLLGPLVFFILCFFLGLFTPGLNHGSHRFLGLFRIFKFLHGGWSPDLTALLRFTKARENGLKSRERVLTPRGSLRTGQHIRKHLSMNTWLPLIGPREGREFRKPWKSILGGVWGGALTGGAAESHSGNQKCHSTDLERFAVGSPCGTCRERAGARHLSTCRHMSALGSSENQPVSGKKQSQQIGLQAIPERRDAKSARASRLAKPPGRCP